MLRGRGALLEELSFALRCGVSPSLFGGENVGERVGQRQRESARIGFGVLERLAEPTIAVGGSGGSSYASGAAFWRALCGLLLTLDRSSHDSPWAVDNGELVGIGLSLSLRLATSELRRGPLQR
jgi:hypothetical protein